MTPGDLTRYETPLVITDLSLEAKRKGVDERYKRNDGVKVQGWKGTDDESEADGTGEEGRERLR